jgi:hypothetical protein
LSKNKALFSWVLPTTVSTTARCPFVEQNHEIPSRKNNIQKRNNMEWKIELSGLYLVLWVERRVGQKKTLHSICPIKDYICISPIQKELKLDQLLAQGIEPTH